MEEFHLEEKPPSFSFPHYHAVAAATLLMQFCLNDLPFLGGSGFHCSSYIAKAAVATV